LQWHAFRRGLATNLHRLGVQDEITQRTLRHSNVGVTQRCYIKTVDAGVLRPCVLSKMHLICTQRAARRRTGCKTSNRPEQ
jgi:hypothetical protein